MTPQRAKAKSIKVNELPAIPDQQRFNISQVAQLCGVEKYVLRYWEQVFPALQPNKKAGNRRSYCQSDVHLIRYIRRLLYEEGFTIAGARTKLETSESDRNEHNYKQILQSTLVELESLLSTFAES